MKKAVIAIVVIIVAAAALLGIPKVRTYLSVGGETLAAQIDKALGEYTVRRTEVKTGITNLEQSAKKIQEGQISSEVQAEQLTQKLAAVNEKKAGAQASLTRLRDLVAKAEPATLGGKQYSVAELQSMAENLITAFKSLETQSSGIEKARDLLTSNAKTLHAKSDQAKAMIDSMHSQLETIDAKLLALTTMRDAAKTAGSGSDLADNFKQVQDQINALYVKVETNLRVEEQSWKTASTGTPVDVNGIINTTADTETTLSKIDAVLGKK